jgi:hypothetical protein
VTTAQRSRRWPLLIAAGAVLATLIALAVIALTARPGAEPASAASTTASATSSAPVGSLRGLYADRLQSLAATWDTACPGGREFDLPCVQHTRDLASLGNQVARAADQRGLRYAEVSVAARDLAAAASNWYAHCPSTQPGSKPRLACVDDLFTAKNGAEGVLAAIYAVEGA